MFSALIKRLLVRRAVLLGIGLAGGVFGLLSLHQAGEYTSADVFCEYCHVHPQATISWKQSTHYKNKSGIVVHCVECHLPPKGVPYYTEKAVTGAKDVYGALFKDVSKIDWEAKSRLEHAVTITYEESCLYCHQDLYSLELSKKGIDAHEHYLKSKGKVRCINCHLYVGHYSSKAKEAGLTLAAAETTTSPLRTSSVSTTRSRVLPPLPPHGPTPDERFVSYQEVIPGTDVQFEMIAVAGGEFTLGSSSGEPYRRSDEGPARKVRVSSFWMGKAEVTWAEYEEFYSQTATRGKNESGAALTDEVDAITGPTPPYGSPDQGWGKGDRPAITMTHHAAMRYCEWLSRVTGRRYRLPTEAEWEYACRAGSNGPYFFPGDPGDFTRRYWFNRWFGVETKPVEEYAWYQLNSSLKSHPPESLKPNPWGLSNLIGNVKEFCLDWYTRDAYSRYSEEVSLDPTGPESGEEHVVRGGSFKSDAVELRSAARDCTRTEAWLATDPQSPKSVWWYSDSNDVGFRVVREWKRDRPAAD